MIDAAEIDLRLARLDAWLETLRGPAGEQGYGGPVAHWWQQSLLYTGPGHDWRYEGIIQGYLALWQRTQEARWLEKARRAGDDLVNAQLPDGHYPFSAFEINPASGGTPHEAAADLGLLRLAQTLKEAGQPGWERYLQTAEQNLRRYYLDKLWDTQANSFRDHPQIPSFVPNKAATACQALFAWSEVTGEARWAEQYAMPNLERILSHQVREPGALLYGAIAQNSFGSHIVPKYMPYYIARCVPGLVDGYAWSGQARLLEAALLAMDFVLRQHSPQGGLYPAIYPKRQRNRWPQWVAPLGDVLSAAELLIPYGLHAGLEELAHFMLSGQLPSGGIQTARGFTAQAGGKPGDMPDLRDLLPVAGWGDKAFLWLARHTSGATLPAAACQPTQAECTLQGQRLTFYEDGERVQATRQGETVYLWLKGEAWAREAAPAFWLH